MANILGIVAEYNPLHNGHLYHIQNAKERTNAEYVVAVITGNFTQRGNTSIVNKWEKARMALNANVDLVIELPTLYSISSAENFADGAIKIFKQLGVTHISFGMETSNIADLNNIAKVLESEPDEYKTLLKEELKIGNSFPKARQNALINYLKDEKYKEVIKGSNNILAIEYLKAIKRNKANIIPVGIKREKVFYHSKKIIDEFASSTGIRYLLSRNQFDDITKVVPSSTFSILVDNINNGTYTKDLSDFSSLIIYKLRTMTKSEIANLPEVSEGLENLIKSSVAKTNSIQELINMINSKRYTKTKIQRILIYALLGITKQDMDTSYKVIPYIRVIGFNNKGKKIISRIENNNVITSVKKFEQSNNNRRYRRMLEIDINATDIYTVAYKKNSCSGLDYTMCIATK